MLAVGKPTSWTSFLRWRWKRKFPILGLKIGETYSTDFNEIPEIKVWDVIYIFCDQANSLFMFRFVLIWVASIPLRHFTQGSAKNKTTKKNTTTSTSGQLLLNKNRSNPILFGLVRELPNKDSNPKRRSHPDHVFSTNGGHDTATSTARRWSQKLWTPNSTPERKPEMIRSLKAKPKNRMILKKHPSWGNDFQQRVRQDEDRNFPWHSEYKALFCIAAYGQRTPGFWRFTWWQRRLEGSNYSRNPCLGLGLIPAINCINLRVWSRDVYCFTTVVCCLKPLYICSMLPIFILSEHLQFSFWSMCRLMSGHCGNELDSIRREE